MLVTAATAWCAKPFVIPELRDWSDNADAGSFELTEDTRIVIPEDACDALARYAQTFADDLGLPLVRESSGFWRTVTFTAESAEPGDILLKVVPDEAANPEGYTLTAGKSGITIQAPTPLGAFWGTRTILQVFADQGNTFPGGEAKDWPEYAKRGFMFDCGRKPFALETLRQLADICSYYKMNELQIHLSDNYIWLHRYGLAPQVRRVVP